MLSTMATALSTYTAGVPVHYGSHRGTQSLPDLADVTVQHVSSFSGGV